LLTGRGESPWEKGGPLQPFAPEKRKKTFSRKQLEKKKKRGASAPSSIFPTPGGGEGKKRKGEKALRAEAPMVEGRNEHRPDYCQKRNTSNPPQGKKKGRRGEGK